MAAAGSYPDEIFSQDPAALAAAPDAAPLGGAKIGVEFKPYVNPFAPRIETPAVRLARKKAEALGIAADEKRAEDAAAFPFLTRDMEATMAHTKQLQGELAQIQQKMMGEEAPSMQQGQLTEGQMTAALISSLFGGAKGFNQALGQGFDEADAAAKRQYAEALDRYERRQKGHALDYETTQNMIQADEELMRMLRKEMMDAMAVQKKQEYDQKILDDKQAAEAEKIRQNNETKVRIAEAKNEIQKNGQLARMGPRGRYEWAIANGYTESEAADLAAWVPSEVNQMAGAELKGAQTTAAIDKNWRENDMHPVKRRQLEALASLAEGRADLVYKQISGYDTDLAIRVAKANAYIANVDSLMHDRLSDNERASFEKVVDGLRDGLKAHHEAAERARKRVQELRDKLVFDQSEHTDEEKKAIAAEIGRAEEVVRSAQESYGELASQVQTVMAKAPKATAFDGSNAGGRHGRGRSEIDKSGGFDEVPPFWPGVEDLKPRTGAGLMERIGGLLKPKKKKKEKDSAMAYGEGKGIKYGG